MFDIIRSYISKEDYYLIIMNKGIYIKNYQKIISITINEILIEINESVYKIIGSDLALTKSIEDEIMIKGQIESVARL